jgi:hypothetical protein
MKFASVYLSRPYIGGRRTAELVLEKIPESIQPKLEFYIERDLFRIKDVWHFRALNNPNVVVSHSFDTRSSLECAELPDEFIARLCLMV